MQRLKVISRASPNTSLKMYVPQLFPVDCSVLRQISPPQATTNPSLILAAAKKPEYASLIDASIKYGKAHVSNNLR